MIEGIDGSGKSTQVDLLRDYLVSKKKKVVTTTEPTKEFIGRLVKKILKGKEKNIDTLTLQMLFIADRADHINKFISPNIAEGNMVISDRYFHSTIVFGSIYGLDKDWLVGLFSKFLAPDAVFFIDTSPEIALKRIMERGEQLRLARKKMIIERHENLKTMIDARKEYAGLEKIYENYYVIDGNRSIKEVNEDIIRIIDKMI